MRAVTGLRGRTHLGWRTGAFFVLLGPVATTLPAQENLSAIFLVRRPAGRTSRTALPDAPSSVRDRAPQEASTPEGNASVSGTVLDSDGAVVKGAFIVLENTTTHDKRAAQSAEDGTFTFTGVAAAAFKVTVSSHRASPPG